MKEIILSNNRGRVLVDDEDYDRLSKFKWSLLIRKNCQHAYRGSLMKERRELGYPATVYFHRELTNTILNEDIIVDHKDFDGLNNQRNNLRVCNKENNQRNQRKHTNGSSIYKGVCWNKQYGKWQVEITVNYKKINLGYYDDEADAAEAYNEGALKHFGKFAHINIIEKIKTNNK